ncbi:hypothetical protein QCB52_01080, partial [Myroides odoratimimus]|uniref:hypothetical protein n=1 Tax=Myroides odoratimimus TaxID=76832 RepID=UPI0038BDE722
EYECLFTAILDRVVGMWSASDGHLVGLKVPKIAHHYPITRLAIWNHVEESRYNSFVSSVLRQKK